MLIQEKNHEIEGIDTSDQSEIQHEVQEVYKIIQDVAKLANEQGE